MDQKSDRRVFARVPLEVEVEVVCDDQELPPLTSRDISEGGMRLGFLGLPTHSTLELTFALPEDARSAPRELPQPFQVQGEVAWRRLSSTGVRFLNLSPTDRKRLQEILERPPEA